MYQRKSETMNNRHLKVKEFYDAFIQEWERLISREEVNGSRVFANTKAWNLRMLDPGGFINDVMNRISTSERKLHYRTEWYKVDALYIGGEDLYKNNLSYPSRVEALIEHELGDKLEEEMWKLIHWRSPLKVIIFYDWSEDEKSTTLRKTWCDNTLGTLHRMLKKVNDFHLENLNTQYLFLIAGRYESKGPFFWWADSNTPFKVKHPCSSVKRI